MLAQLVERAAVVGMEQIQQLAAAGIGQGLEEHVGVVAVGADAGPAQRRLRAGDVGVIVERYPARGDLPEGYELEVFAASGQTIAVVSVPAAGVREATEHEVLSVREMARA